MLVMYVHLGAHFSGRHPYPPLCVLGNAKHLSSRFCLLEISGGSFSPRDAGILKQLPFPLSPRLCTDSTNSSFPTRHLEPQLLETPPLPRLQELASRRNPSTQPPALLLSPPQPRRLGEARPALRPRGDRRPGPRPGPLAGSPPLPQQESSRAVPSAQAKPGAGSTLCTRRPAGGRRQAHGSGGAPGQPRRRGRGACSLRLGARTLRLSGTGSGGEPGAKPLKAPLGPPPGPAGLATRCSPRAPAGAASVRALRGRLRACLGAQTFPAKTPPASPAGPPRSPPGPRNCTPPPSAAKTH